MATINVLLFLLNAVAILGGSLGAYYWYRSSAVKITPNWPLGFEPVNSELSQTLRMQALIDGATEAALFNKFAALFTAVSFATALFAQVMSLVVSFLQPL